MRNLIPIFIALFFVFGSFSTILAAEESGAAKLAEDQKKSEESFLKGVNFGAGIMVNAFPGSKTPIESASVVNGVVRINEESRSQVGVVAEFHSLWPLCKKTTEGKGLVCTEEHAQFGIGPSLGLKLGSDNIVEAIFLGPVFAFRPNINSTISFNLAIGATLAPKVKVLGDGIKENKPLPDGETEIRYKNENRFGCGLMLSFTF